MTNLTLYPIATINITEQNAIEQVGGLWQQVVDKLPKAIRYGIYHNYSENGCQYSIATEQDLGSEFPSIQIDLSWYEVFHTRADDALQEMWQHILRKSKQGLLKRAFTIDVEKYTEDGKVEVWVAVSPHC